MTPHLRAKCEELKSAHADNYEPDPITLDEKNRREDIECDFARGLEAMHDLIMAEAEKLASALKSVRPALSIAREDTGDLYYANVDDNVAASLDAWLRFVNGGPTGLEEQLAMSAKLREPECVCGEINSRNCPKCQGER